jgi:hypothetical protein
MRSSVAGASTSQNATSVRASWSVRISRSSSVSNTPTPLALIARSTPRALASASYTADSVGA